MGEIVHIGQKRAEKYLLMQKRLEIAKKLAECCEITYKTIIQFEHPLRFPLSSNINAFLSQFKREIDELNHKLTNIDKD